LPAGLCCSGEMRKDGTERRLVVWLKAADWQRIGAMMWGG
jgi:hypothetical protein